VQKNKTITYIKITIMRRILLIISLIVSYSTFAQTVSPEGIFSACDNFNNSSAQISWTIGDTQITTIKSTDITITQGFLQSNFIVTSINQLAENENIEVKVFPNPVIDILHLNFSSRDETNLYFYIYNLEGKKVYEQKVNTANKSMEIQFTSFQDGNYILKVSSEDQLFLKTFKILYQK
jgi:hypothetical protein